MPNTQFHQLPIKANLRWSIPPYAGIVCCKLALLATSLRHFLIGEGTWDLEPENVFHSLLAQGPWVGHLIHLTLRFLTYNDDNNTCHAHFPELLWK